MEALAQDMTLQITQFITPTYNGGWQGGQLQNRNHVLTIQISVSQPL